MYLARGRTEVDLPGRNMEWRKKGTRIRRTIIGLPIKIFKTEIRIAYKKRLEDALLIC